MKTFSALLIIVYSTVACMAQSTNNFGTIIPNGSQSVNEVQLSVTVSNNVISVGSMFSIFVQMKNSSTNTIYMSESSPEEDFSVFLISNSGNVYELTPTPFRFTRLMRAKLNPGESRDWVIHVGVNRYFEPPGLVATNKNIEPGDYTLQAMRHFSINDNVFKLDSNSLNIQIR